MSFIHDLGGTAGESRQKMHTIQTKVVQVLSEDLKWQGYLVDHIGTAGRHDASGVLELSHLVNPLNKSCFPAATVRGRSK